MDENLVTVFTPTYNREYILDKCYKSLCSQLNKNFQWLIVDDGSVDHTEKLINYWIQENKISIKYIKQINGGKHLAHNTAITACRTEIFVCVDSDDYLTEDAVDEIYRNWEYVKSDNNLAGIIALKGFSKMQPVRTRMPRDVKKSSIFDLYDKHNFKGDTMLIFKTSILKEYLFPIFEGEKFVTEATIYDKISQKYSMLLVDKILYLCEYLSDGYSQNLLSVHKSNPKGYMFYLSQRVEYANDFKSRYKASSHYIAGCIRIGKLNYLKFCKYKFISTIAFPKSIIIYVKPFIKSKILR